MTRQPRQRTPIIALAVAVLLGSCTSAPGGSPVASPSRSPSGSPSGAVVPTSPQTSAPSATSPAGTAPTPVAYEVFHESFCSAWASMFRAVGNPDTGSGSDLTIAMDAAITAGDLVSVDSIAAQIRAELEAGRSAVERASGWAPASPMMAQIDLVFVGFEAMTEAKRAAAALGLQVAKARGQQALQDAGAIDAWFALIRPGILDDTRHAIESARPPGASGQCETLPIGF